MIKFALFSILIALVVYNWTLFIPISWYESGVGDNIEDIISSHGYPLETHGTVTEDGYILTLHRIPRGRSDKGNGEKKLPIFLMHGLLCSSVDWIINGPNKSMALVLADAGYDVWLGNNRGNTYSRNHLRLDPDSQTREFYNYSYHEIGMYDLPAMIDYILNATGYNQLTYLGYSEGFTSFLVMCSLRPEYNNKILLMNGFAPVTNMYNIKSPLFNLLARVPILLEMPKYVGWYEMISHTGSSLLRLMCSTMNRVCGKVFALLGSSKEQRPNQKLRMTILQHFPAGMSLKQITHYVQGTRTGIFGHFDYGEKDNLKFYGSPGVPLYNLTKVTAPIIVYYGESDRLINNDILLNSVAKELRNVIKAYRIPYPDFDHLDFLYGNDVNKLVVEAVKNINNYNARKLLIDV